MKIQNPINFLLILFIALLAGACWKTSRFSKKPLVENKKIIGQTAPLDMVFIPGDKEIPSFYMGVSEEPNINYLIYLKWLESVYSESYPEVYQNALPKQTEATSLFKFNDPYITAYMTHPAFSYYPVTGLTWVQVQNYLQWKTDRLNEAILIKEGILNFNPEQKDEDNFNTEAFLYGQYEGNVRKLLRDNVTGGERNVKFNDGYLFPGYRLPTEAEWEYANQLQFQKKIDRKRCLNPFSEDAINHPYGQDYFTLKWGERFENSSHGINSGQGAHRQDVFHISNYRKSGFSYTPDEGDVNGVPQRLTSIADYDPKDYGLINMETNVREWVMDFYEETFDKTVKDPLAILKRSGFKITQPAVLDEHGNYVEKDSLGRMRDFRVLGVAHDGKALEVGNYVSEYSMQIKRKESLKKAKDFKMKRLKDLHDNESKFAAARKEIKQSIEIVEYLLKKEKSKEAINRIVKYPKYNYYARFGNHYLSYSQEWLQKQLVDLDPVLLEDNLVSIDRELKSVNGFLKNGKAKKRLIKGGTWQNPGKHRMALEETNSDVEVGFRCVLPYMGMPGPKVKWKR